MNKPREQIYYGKKACLALLENRPDEVIRLYHSAAHRQQLGGVFSWMAAKRLTYREVDEESLVKIAKSTHHEGIAVAAAPLLYRELNPDAARRAASGKNLWLALDGVENPHNLGAIVRSAAFFGVGGVLLGGVDPGSRVNAAVSRVSEGGAEMVPLYAFNNLADGIGLLKTAGFRAIGLETDVEEPFTKVVARGECNGPTVLVLGNEAEGLSRATRTACTRLCVLEGSGELNSLNVSVTAAVALASVFWSKNRN